MAKQEFWRTIAEPADKWAGLHPECGVTFLRLLYLLSPSNSFPKKKISRRGAARILEIPRATCERHLDHIFDWQEKVGCVYIAQDKIHGLRLNMQGFQVGVVSQAGQSSSASGITSETTSGITGGPVVVSQAGHSNKERINKQQSKGMDDNSVVYDVPDHVLERNGLLKKKRGCA